MQTRGQCLTGLLTVLIPGNSSREQVGREIRLIFECIFVTPTPRDFFEESLLFLADELRVLSRPTARFTSHGHWRDVMPSALETIYRQELGYVLQTLKRLGVPAAAAEDVAHDVFITVKARLPDYDESRPVRPWLFGIAMRSAANHRAKAHLRHETNEEADAVDPSHGPAEQSEAASARRLVARALKTLDDDKRNIFVLHELDEVPVPEAAQVLGVPVDTAWSRLRAARREFNEVCLSLMSTTEERRHV